MKLLVIGFGSFLLIAFLIFAVLNVMEPEKKEMQTANSGEVQQNDKTKDKTNNKTSGKANNKKLRSLEKKYKNLQEELENSKTDFTKKDTKIDSLQNLVSQQTSDISSKETQIEKLNEQIAKITNEEKNAKDLSKTFASMKTTEMRPILKNIDDRTIKMIYKNINTRMKKNFLLALTPQRAATLTKQLAVAK